MPLNRRLRTLCTLRSSFAATCGASAPQGRERRARHRTSALNRRAPHARRGTLLFHTDLRHLSHAGRATGPGAESWRPIVAYVPCVRCAPLSRQPAAPQPRRGANGAEHRTSVLGNLRHLGHVEGRAVYRFNCGFLWEAVSFCSSGIKRLAFNK